VSEQGPGGSPELVPGSQVAGYRLEDRIGHGGMAVVFRAYDRRLDRLVALKVLTPALAGDEAFRRRFIRESRAAAAVDHPHIIPIFEAGESEGVLFIAMRYVRGGDVGSLLRRIGPLPAERAAEIVAQMASALDAAHARGLVHRDVKPANMLLDERPDPDRPDHVYLSDFGLTKASLTISGLTAAGQFLGTLDYVAPEQIEGGPIDGRTDQYALACAAFELLCADPPFRRDDSVAVMYAHLHETPPKLRQRRPELPGEVDDVLAKALAKTPAGRYASCRQFAVALRQALGLHGRSDNGTGAAHPATEIAMPVAADAGADQHRPDRPADTEHLPTGPARAPAAGLGSTGGGLHSPTEPGRARGPTLPPARRSRRRVLVPASIAAVVLAAAGGGLALASHGGGRDGVVLPGCTTATARAPVLNHVASATVTTGGGPFGPAVTRDGQFTFVTTGAAIDVLHNTTALAPTLVRSISAPGAGKGAAITHDGKYLLAAAGSGAVVVSVSAATTGAANPVVGSLTSPHGRGAVEVAITRDDQFAFVTLQGSAEMAVFRLQAALTGGFGTSDFVGYVPLGNQPVGIAGGGRWLYVANLGGTISVVNQQKAETTPAAAVVATVRAGCQPARAMLSADAKVLWVTARGSDALLAFSTPALRTDPRRALLAKVMVGETPLGEVFVDGGSKVVVADSNLKSLKGATASLAVVDVANALAGHGGLLGYVRAGLVPRQFATVAHGRILLVTDQGSHQLQALRVSDLP
jgi:hypothetical protein